MNTGANGADHLSRGAGNGRNISERQQQHRGEEPTHARAVSPIVEGDNRGKTLGVPGLLSVQA